MTNCTRGLTSAATTRKNRSSYSSSFTKDTRVEAEPPNSILTPAELSISLLPSSNRIASATTSREGISKYRLTSGPSICINQRSGPEVASSTATSQSPEAPLASNPTSGATSTAWTFLDVLIVASVYCARCVPHNCTSLTPTSHPNRLPCQLGIFDETMEIERLTRRRRWRRSA